MKRPLLIAFCFLIGFTNLKAENDDFGVWTFLGLNKKISNVWNFYTEAEFRSRYNSSTVDCWSLYGEISAKITSFLKAGGGYTFIEYNHPKLSWEPRHRLNAFLTGSYSVNGWSFAVRERYEWLYRAVTDNTQPIPTPKSSLRSRVESTYKVPRSIFAPYATIELYTTLNAPQGIVNDRLRYTLGTQIAFFRRHSLSIYYRYVDYFPKTSQDTHILGVGFRFNI